MENTNKKGIIGIGRHGSTTSNGDKKFRGWEEEPENQITSKGKNDAQKLGESIKRIEEKDNEHN
jgi:bisphosphoglycerate-dependent phosphoglycerate mutase